MGKKSRSGRGPAFSRRLESSVLGKLTAEIPKLKLPEETHEILKRTASDAGMTLSEFCREVLIVRAHGVGRVQSLYRQRFDLVAGTKPNEGGNGE